MIDTGTVYHPLFGLVSRAFCLPEWEERGDIDRGLRDLAAHTARLTWSWRRAGRCCRWHLARFG